MGSYMANKAGETCVVCEEPKANGIHLYTRFICRECEKEMVKTDTSDERYHFYLKQLKKVLQPEQYS
ncbi:sigma factor G inhibitor Gin [Bacillus marinisedimentorum]|uniref:sigma factor G inhibitor Gin n=1 Tax=Bacillus marinisedimentorum TaxID=1821260 RepID=UPI000872CB02|nr:sigma factor G inhibitor Gin [Bacillus marinisedimentorum]